MRLFGLGDVGSLGLGYSDTDVLNAGTVVKFSVSGTPCSGVYENDIRNTLNNWLGSMMSVSSVSTNVAGYIPLHVSVDVTAVVTQPIPAGELRGQIIASLGALSDSVFATTCAGGVSLVGNALQIAPGGTGGGGNPSGNPFDLSPSTLMLAGAVLVLVAITARK